MTLSIFKHRALLQTLKKQSEHQVIVSLVWRKSSVFLHIFTKDLLISADKMNGIYVIEEITSVPAGSPIWTTPGDPLAALTLR